MTRTLRVLCERLVDYAGLFPPAKLSMEAATENYARFVRSEDRWMLGRFICLASGLPAFTEAASVLLPGTHATSGYREHVDDVAPWRLSVVIDGPLEDALDLIDAFNGHHAQEDNGLAVIDAIELRAPDAAFIDEAMEEIPEDLTPFFEIDTSSDVRGPIAALAGESAFAKIRCGGVEPAMIPSIERVARFIDTCAHADVGFKVTAGLHHPVRAEQALTYDDDPPRAVMHGFLNVFLASAFRRQSTAFDLAKIEAMLGETDGGSFGFEDTTVTWKEHEIEVAAIARARESFSLAFGSCSFDEPREDLRALGLLAG